MKKLMLSFCLLLGSLLCVNSYAKSSNHLAITTKRDSILYIVKQPKNNTQIHTFNVIGLIMSHVTNLRILGKDSIDSKYLQMGAKEVCEMTLDSSTVLTSFEALLNKRHVPVSKRKLPIYWNDTLINRKDFWINEKDLKRLVVEDSRIVIELNGKSSSPKKGELMIR